jgi:hypothetical protein
MTKGSVIYDAEPFSERLARVQQAKLTGFNDRSGASAIPPRFKDAEDFSEG